MTGVLSRRDYLTCSLCLSAFKDPRALPCLHTFCLGCLTDLRNSRKQAGTLKCPVCQEHHAIPRAGVGDFRQDFRIQNFEELLDKVVEIFQEKPGRKCSKHELNDADFYCMTCGDDEAICLPCWIRHHRNHNVIPCIEKEKKCSEEEVKNCKDTASKYMTILANLCGRFVRNRHEMKERVTSRVQAYQRILSDLETKIHKNIDTITNSQVLKITTLHAEISKLNLMLEQKENVQDSSLKQLERTALYEITKLWSTNFELPYVEKTKELTAEDFERLDRALSAKVRSTNLHTKYLEREAEALTKGSVKAQAKAVWKLNCTTVQGMVCHNAVGPGVTILSPTQIQIYHQFTGDLIYSEEHEEDDNRIITTYGDRGHSMVDLNSDTSILTAYKFLPLQFHDPEFSFKFEMGSRKSISGTENYLVCISKEYRTSWLYCFSLDYKNSLGIQLKNWTQERSINAMEIDDNLKILVGNSWVDGVSNTTETALIAMNMKGKLWSLSFTELDKDTESFDLLDMSNDGQCFYVLNVPAGCVYRVSANGVVLSRILENLERPLRISINKKTQTLVLARRTAEIAVYNLTYGQLEKVNQ